jgi:hypothetical protein
MAQARVIRGAARASPMLAWGGVAQVRILTVIACLIVWEALAQSGLFYRDSTSISA